MNKVKLAFKKLDPRATLPKYAHDGDAGMDVTALDDVTLRLNIPTLVHTGIAAEIPDGYEIQVRSRSGLALKGVCVYNAPGTVDSKYRGEICVILMYLNYIFGSTPDGDGVRLIDRYDIKAGDRIAQLVLAPVTTAEIVETSSVSETDRGSNGFGSTGR